MACIRNLLEYPHRRDENKASVGDFPSAQRFAHLRHQSRRSRAVNLHSMILQAMLVGDDGAVLFSNLLLVAKRVGNCVLELKRQSTPK